MADESQFIVRGDPIVKLPEKNLSQLLLKKFKQNANQIAMIDAITKEQVTYKQLEDQARRIAVVLKDKGIKRGDAIGFCTENSIYYPTTVVACFFLGVTCSPYNPDYTERELHHTIQLAKPKIILCSPGTIESVVDVTRTLPFVREILLLWSDDPEEGSLQTLAAKVDDRRLKIFDIEDVDEDEVALVMCSSGTTGLPKGVMLTHGNILAHFASADVPYFNTISGYTLGYLPMFHAYGLIAGIYCLHEAITIVILSRFMPDVFLQSIQDYKITGIVSAPPIISFLAKHPMIDEYDLSSLKFIGCGAAPLSAELEAITLKRFPHLETIVQGYGMTESTLGILRVPNTGYKPGSTGIVVPGIEIKIIDPTTGKALGPNQVGELCYRGPLVMKGYIGNLKATKDTIDDDGWLHSGDVAYYDKDKWFYIVDRLKELIKYKGFQVAPAELEALLMTHPAVFDAAVIGIPNDDAGELPKAFIVKQAPVTEKEIIDFISKQVSNAKRLRGGVEFIDEIPKNPSGKILRRDLRERERNLRSKL